MHSLTKTGHQLAFRSYKPMQEALNKLRAETPRPDLSGVVAWDYTLGGYGRYIVDDAIKALPENPVMVEIGCFLCSSTRRWLELRPDLTVIGIDPWDHDGLIAQCRRYVGRPALTRDYPDPEVQEKFANDVATNGPFETALKNVEEFGDRFIPVRDTSPGGLRKLAAMGITPDLVYIDADKKPDDLEVSHELWPNVIISGDDWHWSRTKGYPMRKVVYRFAEKAGFDVRAEHATWILDRQQA